MHALTMLHSILIESCPEVHAKRIASLLITVEAVVSGSRLVLSDLSSKELGSDPDSCLEMIALTSVC